MDVDGAFHIDWSIWHGLDALRDCQPDSDTVHTASLRLIVQFGEQPLVAPLPAPGGSTALATPIFVDAPGGGGNAWEEGRARNAEDLAGRLRALAYGHSDRGDPRHGNGGLLAAGIGAVFAVPAEWWDETPIESLRRSLRDTEIEVIPINGEFDPSAAADTRVIESADCDELVTSIQHDTAQYSTFMRANHDRPFHFPMAGPLPPLIEAGSLSTSRDAILTEIFPGQPGESLFLKGGHRGIFVPVVATRNPLEEISSQNLLTPDRGGQWTLHESLTRRLTAYEINPGHRTSRGISLQELRQLRRPQLSAIATWTPEGSLALPDDMESTLFLLGGEDFAFQGRSRSEPFMAWDVVDGDDAVFEGPLRPVTIDVTTTN